MRIKLGENLPVELAVELGRLGHGVDTAFSEGLGGRDDEVLWAAAGSEHRFFITPDLDFSDIRRYEPGTHNGLMLVRLRHPSRTAIIQRVCSVFEQEPPSRWSECFVVVTDRKVRVRRPV